MQAMSRIFEKTPGLGGKGPAGDEDESVGKPGHCCLTAGVELDARHVGHLQVAQDDIETAILAETAQGLASAEFGFDIMMGHQHALKGLEQQRFVVDGKHASALDRLERRQTLLRVLATARHGRRQAHAKDRASPGFALRGQARRPRAVRYRARWANPDPVPSSGGLVVKNDSKMRGMMSGGDAWAVVLDFDHHLPALITAAHVEAVAPGCRSAKACAALTIRFRNTWPRRAALARTSLARA